jgi:hypothetical protein
VAASIAELENEARYCKFIALGLRGCTGGLPQGIRVQASAPVHGTSVIGSLDLDNPGATWHV